MNRTLKSLAISTYEVCHCEYFTFFELSSTRIQYEQTDITGPVIFSRLQHLPPVLFAQVGLRVSLFFLLVTHCVPVPRPLWRTLIYRPPPPHPPTAISLWRSFQPLNKANGYTTQKSIDSCVIFCLAICSVLHRARKCLWDCNVLVKFVSNSHRTVR